MNRARIFYKYFVSIAIVIWTILAYYDFFAELVGKFLILIKIPNFSQLVTSLVAILNLSFVITIFLLNKKDKQNEETLARKSYWYRNIILDKNIDKIHQCFESIISDINEIEKQNCDDDSFIKVIQRYQEQKRFLIVNVNDMIRISDEEFADILDLYLDNHEDMYTDYVEELFTCSANDWISQRDKLQKSIQNLKKKYFKQLFEYEKNGYTVTWQV